MSDAQLTEQDVFTYVYLFFSKPGVELGRSYVAGQVTKCTYGAPDGRRCGVGCLLTEDELETLDFARSNMALCPAIADQLPERLQGEGVFELLQQIQYEHDASATVEGFLDRLRQWTFDTDLVVPDVPA